MFESRLSAATTGNSESQNMDSNLNIHVNVGAMLQILLGVLGLITAVVILDVFGVVGGIVIWQSEQGAATVIPIVVMLIGGFLAMLVCLGLSVAGDYSHRCWVSLRFGL